MIITNLKIRKTMVGVRSTKLNQLKLPSQSITKGHLGRTTKVWTINLLKPQLVIHRPKTLSREILRQKYLGLKTFLKRKSHQIRRDLKNGLDLALTSW